MANRLEQMAPLLVNNLRQNRTHLLCSQRIIAYTKLQLARAGRSLGLSTALAARQQREGAGITTPAGCQLQREFAIHPVALSLLLSTRPTQQLSFRQFAVLRPSTPLLRYAHANLHHFATHAARLTRCAAFHIPHCSPRLQQQKDSARPSSSTGTIAIHLPIRHVFPRPPARYFQIGQ
jgi:hypothetical protein